MTIQNWKFHYDTSFFAATSFVFRQFLFRKYDSKRIVFKPWLGVHCRTELWRLSYIPEIVAN